MAHKKIGILMAVCVLFGVCFVSCATTSEAHNKGRQHDGMMKDGDMSSDKNMKDDGMMKNNDMSSDKNMKDDGMMKNDTMKKDDMMKDGKKS